MPLLGAQGSAKATGKDATNAEPAVANKRSTMLVLKLNATSAARSLLMSKQRSLLALIGIGIGVGSVIAMITVGAIAKTESLRHFIELGTDILTVRPSGGGNPWDAAIQLEDALAMADKVPAITVASPWSQAYGAFVYAGKEIKRGQILGVTASFEDLHKLEVPEGRFLSDLDFRRYFVVVGADVAKAMRQVSSEPFIGQSFKADGRRYFVIGELAQVEENDARTFNPNNAVYIPISTSARVFSNPSISQIIGRISPDVVHTQATRDVRRYFRDLDPDLALRVTSAAQLIRRMEQQSQLFTLLLGAIGSISLLVGGIGVMNVMLVSVSEKRKEVGIRRALGARRGDIQGQFLTESIILSIIGGGVGLAMGVGGAYGICQYSDWPFEWFPSAMALGVGVASAVGIFFGFYPAHQAARLDPVEALRSG